MVYKAWHSLQNFLPKGYRQFWLKVVLLSLAGHITVMFLALVNKSSKPIELTVFSKSRPVEVVFVPLYKKMAGVQKRINTAKKAKTGKTPAVKNIVAKTVVKPSLPKKVEVKKPDVKKIEPVKKIIEPKKIEPKPKIVPKKTDLKLQEQQVVAKEPEPIIENIVEPELNEPIYIGRHDLQNLQMALELEAVIVQSWQPPLGLSKEIECTVELVVDGVGKVTNFLVKKSSGVAVYDMSVKRIFSQIVMPASICNKTLTIVFKQ